MKEAIAGGLVEATVNGSGGGRTSLLYFGGGRVFSGAFSKGIIPSFSSSWGVHIYGGVQITGNLSFEAGWYAAEQPQTNIATMENSSFLSRLFMTNGRSAAAPLVTAVTGGMRYFLSQKRIRPFFQLGIGSYQRDNAMGFGSSSAAGFQSTGGVLWNWGSHLGLVTKMTYRGARFPTQATTQASSTEYWSSTDMTFSLSFRF